MAQEKTCDERMSAQVAPASSGSSTPHLDSRPQSQSASYTTSQPAEPEPLVPAFMLGSISGSDFDTSLGSSAVDVDSPAGAEPQIEMEHLVSSLTQGDPNMDSQLLDHVHESSRTQEEKPVDQTIPITSPSTEVVNHKISATPPNTVPLVDQIVTAGSAPEHTTGPPTPLTTAPFSDWAPSALEIFELRSKGAIQKHFERTKIFHKTRSSMIHQSEKTLVFASRGFERGNLPTRQTKPPLLKRRHSIDVNTTRNWEMQNNARWLYYNLKEYPSWSWCYEMEPPLVISPYSQLPDPRRYSSFGPAFYTHTPHNNETFLELGDVVLQNDAFNYIGATNCRDHGIEVWMRGESLDMALEVLRRDENCDAYGIGIANSTVAQICNFAAMDSDGPSGEYEQYKARYNNKNWIIVVCNDAMGGIENNGTSGSHWSMVAMDRISKLAYYYDSLYAWDRLYQNLGRSISLGMLNILGEDCSQWTYEIQYDSPDQNDHNLYKYDGGPCGPFVFKMTQILIRYIKEQQMLGQDQLSLSVDYDFAVQKFKPQFHSAQVRDEIQTRILRWHHISRASALADQHDRHAIYDTNAVLNDGPVVTFEIPKKSRVPVLRRTRHMDRYSRFRYTERPSSSGTNYHDPIELDDSDKNYVIHNNSSDSSGSTESSSGSDTVVFRREDCWKETSVDVDMDNDNLDPDLDGGIRIIDETDAVQNERAHTRYQRVVDSSPEPDDAGE